MIREHKYILVILGAIFSVSIAFSQQPHFSQFTRNPVFYNPAFAGNTIRSKANLNYRNQWPALKAHYVTSSASVELNFDEFNSGFAALYLQDNAGSMNLTTRQFSLNYAYNLRLSRNMRLRMGLSSGYGRIGLDISKLIFGDQIILRAPVSGSVSQLNMSRVNFIDLGTGILLFQKNWWVGTSVHHFNAPNISLKNLDARMPPSYSFQGGAKIWTKKDIKKVELYSLVVLSSLIWQRQWKQHEVGVNFRYKILSYGMLYRQMLWEFSPSKQLNHDAIVFWLGYQSDRFSVAYSYDLGLFRFPTGGAHELSLQFEFASTLDIRKFSRKRYLVPCPKF